MTHRRVHDEPAQHRFVRHHGEGKGRRAVDAKAVVALGVMLSAAAWGVVTMIRIFGFQRGEVGR